MFDFTEIHNRRDVSGGFNMITRRFFIGGAASLFASGPKLIFADAGAKVSVRAVSSWGRCSAPLVGSV